MPTDTDQRLVALMDHVERQLQIASQGSALCALSRSGQPVSAVKYFEGAWAALAALRRSLRTTPIADALPALMNEWQTDLEARTAAGAHANWIAYCTGGVEHLEQFAATLDGAQPAP